jgi:hypothetical protein
MAAKAAFSSRAGNILQRSQPTDDDALPAIGERLPVVIAHDNAGIQFVD